MATSVTVLHNPEAGFENYSSDGLLKILQEKGYEVSYFNTKEDPYEEKLKQGAGDLLVIAGGDGTVIKTASKMIGKGVPIGLLPLGTANNIASSLGISGEPADIVAAWDLSKKTPFDVGIAKGPEGENIFMESAGFGLLPRLIREHSEQAPPADKREEELEAALRHQLKILKEYKARYCTINADGQEFSGNYLLLEVMNVKLAGPRLNLAPQANPGDGLLDVVMVRENERSEMEAWLEKRIKGQNQSLPLPVIKAKNLKVEWHGQHYHLDSKTKENNAPVKIDIELNLKGLEFLLI